MTEEYLEARRKEIEELRKILKGDCSLDGAESRLIKLEQRLKTSPYDSNAAIRHFESFYGPLIKDARARAQKTKEYLEREKPAG